MRERTFWRTTAWTLGVLLVGLVAARASGAIPVPSEAIALTASTLFCLGVGRTVVSPRMWLYGRRAPSGRNPRATRVEAPTSTHIV